MRTNDKESELLNRYRSVSIFNIKYIGNFFACFWIEILTHSMLFKKSWVDSSAKSDLPSDFHNDKHHIMMEMMRVDDCIGELNGEHVKNAFEKENLYLKKYLGNDYKNVRDDINVFFIPYTDDPVRYTYDGYCKNFRNAIVKHSNKIEKYKNNYPKCNKTIFFISDESNEFCEAMNLDEKKLIEQGKSNIKVKWHIPYIDNKFINIIKESKCDYIIWYQHYKITKKKHILINPKVVIIDIKNFKNKGIDYNLELMAKVKEEHNNGKL